MTLLSAFATSPALAQTAPLERPIQLTFTGVVTDDIANSIRIRQPDGSFTNYAGPVPEFPYKRGDEVKISFTATVPTSEYYKRYVGQQSADGIYRIAVSTPIGAGGSPFGVTRDLDVSGPIRAINTTDKELSTAGLFIVLDTNTDSYSLDFRSDGSWFSGPWDVPGFRFDAESGLLTSAPSTCYGGLLLACGNTNLPNGGFGLRGTADTVTAAASGIPIWRDAPDGSIGPGGTPAQIIGGFFNLNIAGSWNLPIKGGPTPVPEPDMMVLFGLASGWLVWRRRRALHIQRQ